MDQRIKPNGAGQIPEQEPERQLYFVEQAKALVDKKQKELGRPLTCMINTFGCQMNARDSEKLLGILEQIGFVETESEEADFVLYNTCTVRDNANQKVYGRLGALQNKKKKNPNMMIALCGCMMQEPTVIEKIKKSYSYVDIIFGTHNIYKLAELVYRRMTGKKMVVDVWQEAKEIVEDLPIERKYPFKSGVNIMFGCNNFCSYCIVPYTRGRERSRPVASILAELADLRAKGYKEVTLLGQNVNSYNYKPDGEAEPVTFARLLAAVAEAAPDMRVRFTTSHPKDMTDDILVTIARYPNICHHIHLPVQSGSNAVLKAMNRHYTREWYLDRIAAIRRIIPDCGISTDMFTGFHGETEEDFLLTLSLMREVGFQSAFMFKYSERPGTVASRTMPDNIPEEVKIERLNRMIALQNELSAKAHAAMVGREVEVLIEGVAKRSKEQMVGRTPQNMTVVVPRRDYRVGQTVKVTVRSATSATLIAD